MGAGEILGVSLSVGVRFGAEIRFILRGLPMTKPIRTLVVVVAPAVAGTVVAATLVGTDEAEAATQHTIRPR